MTSEEVNKVFRITCKKCDTMATVTDKVSVIYPTESHDYDFGLIKCKKCGAEATLP